MWPRVKSISILDNKEWDSYISRGRCADFLVFYERKFTSDGFGELEFSDHRQINPGASHPIRAAAADWVIRTFQANSKRRPWCEHLQKFHGCKSVKGLVADLFLSLTCGERWQMYVASASLREVRTGIAFRKVARGSGDIHNRMPAFDDIHLDAN
jgi:hypothetical protein